MKIYLAGPMRGYPKFNFPAFEHGAQVLRAQGHTVFSPAENDKAKYGHDFGNNVVLGDAKTETPEFDLRAALAADTHWIATQADAIALLPGWEKSTGAFAEWALARALGLEIWYFPPTFNS